MRALHRVSTAQRRADAARARMDARDWRQDRRDRTRRLIELGGLVAKSGLEEIIAAIEPDTRAAILGALMQLADELQQPAPRGPSSLARASAWRERGRKALRAPEMPWP